MRTKGVRVKPSTTREQRRKYYTMIPKKRIEQLSYSELLRVTSIIETDAGIERRVAIKNIGRLSSDEDRIVKRVSGLSLPGYPVVKPPS